MYKARARTDGLEYVVGRVVAGELELDDASVRLERAEQRATADQTGVVPAQVDHAQRRVAPQRRRQARRAVVADLIVA